MTIDDFWCTERRQVVRRGRRRPRPLGYLGVEPESNMAFDPYCVVELDALGGES